MQVCTECHLLRCFSFLHYVLGLSFTQGPTKVDAEHTLTERVYNLNNVLEEIISSQFYS